MMRLAAVATVTLAAALFAFPLISESASQCSAGTMRGFAAVTGDPLTGAGGIPDQFTASDRYFASRYNCARRLTQVRRRDLGVYQVRFPANPAKVGTVSAYREGIAASVERLRDGTWQVVLRTTDLDGHPLRRDVPFSLLLG